VKTDAVPSYIIQQPLTLSKVMETSQFHLTG